MAQSPTLVCAQCDSENQEGSAFFGTPRATYQHSRDNAAHNLFKPVMIEDEYLATEGVIQ